MGLGNSSGFNSQFTGLESVTVADYAAALLVGGSEELIVIVESDVNNDGDPSTYIYSPVTGLAGFSTSSPASLSNDVFDI